MSFSFHPEADEEYLSAIDWYEERSPGLGLDFSAEMRGAINRAESMPLAWQMVEPDIRRVLVRRFPYAVVYGPNNGGIYILAVMHLRREPGYWLGRH